MFPCDLSLGSADETTEHVSPTAKFESLTPNSPTHVKSYLQAYTPCDFRDAPLIAVQTLLSFDALSLSEDDVFNALFRYVCRRASIPPTPIAWTPQQRQLVTPELSTLLPLIRLYSVSVKLFLHIIEPLQLVSEAQRIAKYRFEAFKRTLLCKTGSFNDLFCIYDNQVIATDLFSGLRRRTIIEESSHPYRPGSNVVSPVYNSNWATDLHLEFDQRSVIGEGARLMVTSSHKGRSILSSLQPKKGTVFKVSLASSSSIKFHLEVKEDATPQWGFKVLATTVFKGENVYHVEH